MNAVEHNTNLLKTLRTCEHDTDVTVRGIPMKIGVHAAHGGMSRRVYLWGHCPEDTTHIDVEHHLDPAEADVYVRRPSDGVALLTPEQMEYLIRHRQFWVCK